MNCATMVPEDRYFYDKERSNSSGHDRRVSRGLASCLRGESEECHDYEAEGNSFIIAFFGFYIFHFQFFALHFSPTSI